MKPSQIIAKAIFYLGCTGPRNIEEWKEIGELIQELGTIMLEMQQKEMQNKETNK